MRGLKTDPTARVIVRGHAFMQNLLAGQQPNAALLGRRRRRVWAGLGVLVGSGLGC